MSGTIWAPNYSIPPYQNIPELKAEVLNHMLLENPQIVDWFVDKYFNGKESWETSANVTDKGLEEYVAFVFKTIHNLDINSNGKFTPSPNWRAKNSRLVILAYCWKYIHFFEATYKEWRAEYDASERIVEERERKRNIILDDIEAAHWGYDMGWEYAY